MIENYLHMSSQDISRLSNTDLESIYMKIRSEIITKNKLRKNTKDLEILYCYIAKEIETRE